MGLNLLFFSSKSIGYDLPQIVLQKQCNYTNTISNKQIIQQKY